MNAPGTGVHSATDHLAVNLLSLHTLPRTARLTHRPWPAGYDIRAIEVARLPLAVPG
ncbi:MAG: hypothetical protein ACRBB4_01455 [Neptuniibacter sp.]